MNEKDEAYEEWINSFSGMGGQSSLRSNEPTVYGTITWKEIRELTKQGILIGDKSDGVETVVNRGEMNELMNRINAGLKEVENGKVVSSDWFMGKDE